MSKRSRYSAQEKYEMIKAILSGKESCHEAFKRLPVSEFTLNRWVHNFKTYGIEGLQEVTTCKRYNPQIREAAVLAILTHKMTLIQAINFYEISSSSLLRQWISSYTEGDLNQRKIRGRYEMKNGKQTTYEERIEIVKFTIANETNYQKAMEKYGISYTQIYSWVRKYRELGETALQDKRGRKKEFVELTEAEQLKLRIKELEARNRMLEIEQEFGKKLVEIQRRNRR